MSTTTNYTIDMQTTYFARKHQSLVTVLQIERGKTFILVLKSREQ